MGTLASELGPHANRLTGQPRIYVDANVPAGLVAFMRTTLHWDVLFVIEHDDLRFPAAESGGVLVLTAPEERGYIGLLRRLDADLFRVAAASGATVELLP